MTTESYEAIKKDDYPQLVRFMRRISERLDALEGRTGTTTHYSILDMNGNKIVSGPIQNTADDTDFITKSYLGSVEAAKLIQSHLTIGGAAPLTPTNTYGGTSTANVRVGLISARGSAGSHVNELFIATDVEYSGYFSNGATWSYVGALMTDGTQSFGGSKTLNGKWKICSNTDLIDFATAAGVTKWYAHLDGDDLRFWDTADRITFKKGGNVGIGTTNPGAALDARSNSIPIQWGDLSNKWADLNYDGVITAFMRAASGRKIGIGANNRFTDIVIGTDGKVGIGTVNPSSSLHVGGGTDADTLVSYDGIFTNIDNLSAKNTIRNNNGVEFGNWVSVSTAYSGTLTNHPVVWRINNTTVGRIDTSGNFAIGTEIPNSWAALDITSSTKAVLLSRLTTTNRDLMTPVDGMIIYNETTSHFQGYQGGAWVDLA